MPSGRTVAELGESALLEMLIERIPLSAGQELLGDDAAILAWPSDEKLLVSTDMLVQGIDFDLGFSSCRDVGWKALAVNVSDIAAMGGRPKAALVSLGMPGSTFVSEFEGLLEGMIEGCSAWELSLAGGDLSEASEIVVNVAILGSATTAPVVRSGAEIGDALCVTGELGGSGAGLLALQHGLEGTSAEIDAAIARHRRPQPRSSEGPILGRLGVTAMIDVSDGLGIDLLRLLDASQTGCELRSSAIPIGRGVSDVAAETGKDPVAVALGGGEDHELLFTARGDSIAALEEAMVGLGCDVSILGRITAGEPLIDGEPLREQEGLGWEHLKNR